MKELKVFEEWDFIVPDLKKAEKKFLAIAKELEEADSEEAALKAVKKYNRENDKLENEATHISVLYSLDTRNKQYEDAMNVLNEGLPVLNVAMQKFEKALLASKYRPYLEEKLGKLLFLMHEYSVKSFDESIVEESIEENKLTMEYDALIAGAQIKFDGKVLNLPQMAPYLQSTDRDVRKKASKAYYGYLSTIRPQIEDIYDKLVHLRDKMAKKLGYKNYVELGYIRMSRFDYNKDDVNNYRKQIAEVVTPIAAKIQQAALKRIGIKSPHIYDLSLSFAEGNPKPIGTTLDKINNAQKMYDQMSEETSTFFKFMDEHHLLQLEAKEGKQSGGYMTYFPLYKTPIIFSNFNGTSGDVDVLTHEFGHAFQGHLSSGFSVPEYRMPTMESCEIHSMSMEFFAHPYMDLFFNEPERYKYVHLADAISFLPYGVTVDHFQEWVYENPNATKEERNQKWHELELLYTPHVVKYYKDCEYRQNGGRWLTQGHIFSSPFYYIDYTLAQVVAFEFFNLDRKNHKQAWNKYIKLCKMGGKYPFRTLVSKVNLKDPFVDGTIKKVVKPLLKELKSYNI